MGAIGGGAFAPASLVVGGRLRVLTRPTRQLPELLGSISARTMWLALVPPKPYLDWVLARAGTEA